MAYNHDYIEDLALFASTGDAALDAVQLALNTIDASDLPDGALDTQHFSVNWLVGVAGTLEYWAGITTVDEALHTVSTWPPVYAEWQPGNTISLGTPWDQNGDYGALEIFGNAQLTYVASGAATTSVVMAIAVQQSGSWSIIPNTVRVYSTDDHIVASNGEAYLDMPVHTVLFDGDLASSADVTGVRLVWGIRGGGGSTLAYIGAYNLTVIAQRTGDLGV